MYQLHTTNVNIMYFKYVLLKKMKESKELESETNSNLENGRRKPQWTRVAGNYMIFTQASVFEEQKDSFCLL